MADSIYKDLLDSTVNAVDELALMLGDVEVRAEKRKLPTAQESIDVLPLIAVTGNSRPVRDVPFDSGGTAGRRLREYAVGVALIFEGNKDTKKDLDAYLEMRQKIIRRFGQRQMIAVEGLLFIKVEPGAVIDRRQFNRNYDYLAITLIYGVVEDN